MNCKREIHIRDQDASCNKQTKIQNKEKEKEKLLGI